jgi:hypothetical protein
LPLKRRKNQKNRSIWVADLQSALKPLANPSPGLKSVRLTVDTTAKVEPRTPGPASRGEMTQPKKSPDAIKQQRDEAIKKVLDKYRSQIPDASATPH